ncbi:FadR/GntR family transcriptional regulator [Ideonella sp. A 288]|uniref:FadR/GntR family transcriptional regulator n=1 Tax=Ideonella sp. A 288 TaxID=1962181 RepID=UPI000B4AFF35|nr:FadR/GntR family transcriptional regulator [Ideonella sp. A 288]
MALAPSPATLVGAGRLVAESLSDRLATRLVAMIDTGQLKPGDRLPTEAQLSATHGVSRSVVREAVHRIKSRGLLLSRQGSGVFVAAQPEHKALQFDPAVLGSVTNLLQVLEVRRVMEGEIAALAAERATKAQIAALRRALQAIDAASARGEDGVAEDLAFHLAIAEASGNPQFSQLLGFLGQYLRDGMRITRANEARRADFMEAVRHEHHAVVDAIAARDARAARRAANLHMDRGQLRLEHGGVITRQRAAPRGRSHPKPTEKHE